MLSELSKCSNINKLLLILLHGKLNILSPTTSPYPHKWYHMTQFFIFNSRIPMYISILLQAFFFKSLDIKKWNHLSLALKEQIITQHEWWTNDSFSVWASYQVITNRQTILSMEVKYVEHSVPCNFLHTE